MIIVRARLVLGLALLLGLFCASVSYEALVESASTRARHASNGLTGEPAPDAELPAIVAAPLAPVTGPAKLAVPPQRLPRSGEHGAVAATFPHRPPVRAIRPLQFPLLI
jgi:hypothetical protein